jgi:hypothetical protein
MKMTEDYVNATVLCGSYGKKFHDWRRGKKASATLASIARSTGIAVEDLIRVHRGFGEGGVNRDAGTWVHPLVAVEVSHWCGGEEEIAFTLKPSVEAVSGNLGSVNANREEEIAFTLKPSVEAVSANLGEGRERETVNPDRETVNRETEDCVTESGKTEEEYIGKTHQGTAVSDKKGFVFSERFERLWKFYGCVENKIKAGLRYERLSEEDKVAVAAYVVSYVKHTKHPEEAGEKPERLSLSAFRIGGRGRQHP